MYAVVLTLIAAQLVACLALLAVGLLHGLKASHLRAVERHHRVVVAAESDEVVSSSYQSSLSS